MSMPKLKDEGLRLSTLRFDIEVVKKLHEHAKACERHRLSFAGQDRLYGEDGNDEPQEDKEKAAPAVLHLAKDDGIYLMSSGLPGLKGDDGKSMVCYAKGFDPRINDNYYNDARHAVGGDDFVEDIDPETLEGIFANVPRATELIVDFYKDKYTIDSYTPPLARIAAAVAPNPTLG